MYILLSCPSAELGAVIQIVRKIINIIQIIVPILLMVSLTLKFIKLMKNPEDKKAPKELKNTVVASVLIFFIPFIVGLVMNVYTDSDFYNECIDQDYKVSFNPNYIKTTDNDKLKKSVLQDPSDYENGEERPDNTDNSNYTSPNVSGKGNFTKYSLSDGQVKQITALCLHEQGTPKGAAAEASLIANRFEMYGSKYGSGANGIVSYLKNCGWFAHASRNMSDTGVVTQAAYNAVKSVLVEGKRVLPKYVDEHDCFSDLSSVTTNGSRVTIKDRSKYVMHNTKIKNRYGSSYTFYSFPEAKSDPFGYTKESNRTKYGDDCYSYGG